MGGSRRTRTIIAAVLAAALAAGCGAEVKDVVRDPGFAATQLESGRIVVGGVTSALSRLSPDDREAFAEALFRAFLVARPDLVVWPAANLGDAIGPEAHVALLDEARLSHRLPPERVRAVGAELPGVSYLVLARIERDDVERPSTHGSADLDAAPQGSYQSTLQQEMKSKRTLEVALTVYDLVEGRAVWIGSAADAKTNSYGFAESTTGVTPPDLSGALDASRATPSSRDDSRAAPDLVDMIQDVCAELVGSLPGAPAGD